jgi:hypothetical protein
MHCEQQAPHCFPKGMRERKHRSIHKPYSFSEPNQDDEVLTTVNIHPCSPTPRSVDDILRGEIIQLPLDLARYPVIHLWVDVFLLIH